MKSTDLDGICKRTDKGICRADRGISSGRRRFIRRTEIMRCGERDHKTADIEVLVNAAGVGHYGLHEELTPKKIQALVRTNLEIPLLLTNRLLRVLKKNHGYIINISSVTAKQSSPHGCAYAATKAGLSSFGKSLFEEARKYGVKVTTIHPDMTDTNLYRDADFTCGEEPESYLLPDEVAKAVAYVLDQREGMVVPEITLRPQLHRIARK